MDEKPETEEMEEMEVDSAFLPGSFFKGTAKPGTRVSLEIVDVDGDSGEVEVRVAGAEEEEEPMGRDMVAGIDSIPMMER
jgi:hypothetical protein